MFLLVVFDNSTCRGTGSDIIADLVSLVMDSTICLGNLISLTFKSHKSLDVYVKEASRLGER